MPIVERDGQRFAEFDKLDGVGVWRVKLPAEPQTAASVKEPSSEQQLPPDAGPRRASFSNGDESFTYITLPARNLGRVE